MIINQNILAILGHKVVKSEKKKKFMKNFTPSKLPQLLPLNLNFLAKFLTEIQYLMKTLTHYRLVLLFYIP